MTNNITNKLAEVINNIEKLCQKHHRSPKDVHLLAVSKTKPASDIRSAFNAGQRCFGENYLQEAIGKMQELNDLSIEWHFIGSIQSNKTKDLATHFDWIHSVDRLKIAKRLSEQRPATAAALNICLQINISNESSKSGFHLDEIDSIVDEVMMLPNITLRGLMAIPAKTQNDETQHSAFAKMNHALCRLQKKHAQLDTLSMGMSGDMEAAIAEGSTILRIGTAIFGSRNNAE